jgi:hypothetical protein
MPAGDDYCNRQVINQTIQNVSTDEERGLPAVGKIVYDLRDSSLYVCTDTDPDPDENGGGTWTALSAGGGGGASWTSVQPRIWQNNTLVSINSPSSRHEYVVDGDEIRGWFKIYVTGSGSAGNPVHIRFPPYGGNGTVPAFICGYGTWYNTSVYRNVTLWSDGTDSGPFGYNGLTFRMIVDNTAGSVGSDPSTALGSGHQIHGHYLVRGTANGTNTT